MHCVEQGGVEGVHVLAQGGQRLLFELDAPSVPLQRLTTTSSTSFSAYYSRSLKNLIATLMLMLMVMPVGVGPAHSNSCFLYTTDGF